MTAHDIRWTPPAPLPGEEQASYLARVVDSMTQFVNSLTVRVSVEDSTERRHREHSERLDEVLAADRRVAEAMERICEMIDKRWLK